MFYLILKPDFIKLLHIAALLNIAQSMDVYILVPGNSLVKSLNLKVISDTV